MLKSFCLLASSVLMSAALFAQSAPTGEGPWRPVPVWFGAEFSTFNPDYFCQSNSPFSCWSQQKMGLSTFVDMNRLLLRRVGAEGETRFLRWSGSGSLTMTSYLGGPRFELLHITHQPSRDAFASAGGVPPLNDKSLTLQGKFLIGDGSITLQKGLAGSGHFFVMAPGLVADYQLSRRVIVRLDYEYQRWPSFRGDGTGRGGLTPNGLSFGMSYLLLR